MLLPTTIDKIGKINILYQLKSLKNASIHHSFRRGKTTFLLLSKITIKEGVILKDNIAIRIRQNRELILGRNVKISDYVSINCIIGIKSIINRSIPANSIIMSKVQNLKIPLI